ncbi:trace amine-associated receptor 4-like [Paramacrobiotus metropolitanus]|uniref:trace amine-associated receptor 4-like n=1 Tax=Paramacrobiotus metropolitanus TaxID=2943436 RepID=UPI002445FC21|nr:trace amine-associated receptor 4-like [Paramacrobiotus metropolitanus]
MNISSFKPCPKCLLSESLMKIVRTSMATYNFTVPEDETMNFSSTASYDTSTAAVVTVNVIEVNDARNAAIFCGLMIPCVFTGGFGHVMVLLSIFYHEELYRPLNIILANLTVAQFCMLFITVFGSTVVMLNYSDYSININQRDIVGFLTKLFSTATSVFYGLIALNRVMATIYETLYTRIDAWKVVWILSISGWFLSLLAALIPWMAPSLTGFTWDTYFVLGHPWFAATNKDAGSALSWILMCAYFFIPSICVIMCYCAVFARWTNTQQLAGVPINSQKAINLRDRARVLWMLAITSIVYLLCFYATYIFWSTGPHSKAANYFFLWLIYVENAVNPALYGAIYPKFREAYFRVALWILRRWSCRKPYGDTRRIFPVGGDTVGSPPSVVFQSAKNSIIFQNSTLNGAAASSAGNDNQFITVKQLPTSAKNFELKISEISGSVNSRSHQDQSTHDKF